MNIERLSEFLDLANTLSFTATADNLHMAQSTLSRHISDLERTLGFKLFNRTASSVKLTPEGREFYAKAASLTASFNDTISHMRVHRRTEAPVVRVSGSTLQPRANQLLSLLAEEGARLPCPVRFEYHKTRTLSNEPPAPFSLDLLEKGEIGLAIETLPFDVPSPKPFRARKLLEEPIAAVAAVDHPLARKSEVSLEELAQCRLVTLAVHKHCPNVMTAPFTAAGMSPEHIEVRYIDNILEIPWNIARLEEDQFIPLQRSFCEYFGFGSGGTTTFLDLDDPRAKLNFWALWKDSGTMPESVVALIEGLSGRFDDAMRNEASVSI